MDKAAGAGLLNAIRLSALGDAGIVADRDGRDGGEGFGLVGNGANGSMDCAPAPDAQLAASKAANFVGMVQIRFMTSQTP